jgi:hypothetical protein
MAEEIPTDTPIEQEVIETPQADVVETEPVSDGGRTNLQNLYEALKSDKVFSEYVPRDGFDSFVKAYSKPKDIANLYNALKDDSVFSEYLPPTLMGAVEYFGLGKPSAVPSASVGGGSATKGRGVEQPSTLPTKSSEASLDNIQQTMQVYADGKGAFPETLSAADVKELRKQVPGGELPNISDEKVAKMLAGKSPKQVRIESVNAIPDIKERKTEQARMYKDFAREKSVENAQLDQNITALTQGLEQIKAEGENLQQQLQNPNIDPQTAAMLSGQLQQIQANYDQASNDYNNELDKYQQNARFIKTMGAGVESNLKGLVPSTILNPRSPSDVMAASAWNATAPALLKTLGAVVEIMPTALPTDRNVVSNAIFKLADNVTVDVGKYSPQANVSLMDDVNVYNTSLLFGNLLGSVAMTFGGGAAAGTIGAQAAGFSQVYGDVYKQGRDAGLTEAESMFFALPTGLVAAYFGDKGVETLAGAFTKTSLKSAIKQGVKELAEKRTPQMMMEFGQKVLTNTLEGAAKEGLQEGSEFVTEFGSKKGASLKEGVKFQDDLSLKGFGKGLAESAIGGAAGGGLLGPFFGAGRNKAFSDVVNKAARDPQAEADFMEQVNASVAANDITPEQKQQMVEMLEKTKQAATTVPPVVESEPARSEATALVLEQQDLQEQIEQTNPAMAKPLNDRLGEVNNRLGEIAEGKNLPQEEEAPTERKVKTLEEEINIGDTVDLTPLVESSKAKVEVQADNISKEDNDKWTSIIDQSTSPRELDKIIDSIDADGQMTPDLITAINTKRESLSPQATPTAEAPQTLSEVEQARADIEARREEEHKNWNYDRTKPNPVDAKYDEELATLEQQAPVAEEAKGEDEQVITLPPEIDSLDDNEIVSIKYETFDEIPESLKSKANKFGGKDVKYRKSILGIPVGKEFTSKTKEGYVVTALGSEIKDAARQTLDTQTTQAPIAEEVKGEVTPKIILSGAHGGFKGVSNDAFDLRAKDGIREEINANNSFAKIFEYKGKKYVAVGLVLSLDSQRGNPNGRNNYSFAVAEYNDSTPSNILETLENSARKNFKTIYPDFKESDTIDPISSISPELSNIAERQTPTAESPVSEQAPQPFPAQEGAESVEDKFQANSELEQIYRELQDAVNKNIDEQTLRILKANPSEAMIKKAFDILQSKGVIKIDCN